MAKRDAPEALADAQPKRPKRKYLPWTIPSKPSALSPPRPFFELLPRDIRNLIYDYLAFPTLANISDTPSGFALTCRQAHAEAREGAARNLWLFWISIMAEHTDCKLKLPRDLNSKDALFNARQLTICVNRAF
jgi:hypothetical protein